VYSKLLEANNVAFASQEKSLKLTEQVSALKEELMKLKDLQAQAKDYELADLGGGVFGYLYKPAVQTGKPRHLACVKSFSEHGIGILQNEYNQYRCSVCKATVAPLLEASMPSIDKIYEYQNARHGSKA
jgi:hypothetical protein